MSTAYRPSVPWSNRVSVVEYNPHRQCLITPFLWETKVHVESREHTDAARWGWVNQAPTVPDVDTLTDEDSPLEIPVAWLLQGATDPEGDSLVGLQFTSLDFTGGVFTFNSLGGDTLIVDSTYDLSSVSVISYLPEAHYFGTLSQQFRVIDAQGQVSELVTFTLEVTSVNDPPSAFFFESLDEDTLHWSGGLINPSWTTSLDVEDTVRYTWHLNLRDTVVEVFTDTDTEAFVSLDPGFLNDPGAYVMWVEATDGTTITRTPLRIFEVEDPRITGLFMPSKGRLSVYPNPATTTIQVKIPKDAGSGACLRLLDVQGRELAVWNCTGEEQQKVNLPPGLTSGSYYLLLESRQLPSSRWTVPLYVR